MKRCRCVLLVVFLLLVTALLSACDGDFTIHFDSTGGTPIESVYGEGLNQPAYVENEPVPIRDGYEFAGWYKNKYFTGERIVFPYVSQSGDGYTMTLYAKWEKT